MDFKLNKSNLNFRIYTAASLPATGNENDICIISEVPMTNWVMSPDKPSGAPRTDGDVWIQYSVTGNVFNVLKNSTMLIATISAWQYVSGAWADVVAKRYRNGEWVDRITAYYIFKSGEGELVPLSITKQTNGTFTKTNDAITVGYTSNSSSSVYISTTKKIDLTGFTTLHVVANYTENVSGYGAMLGVHDQIVAPGVPSMTRYKNLTTGGGELDHTFDVSGFKESLYIGLVGCMKMVIKEIYLD